MKQILTCLIVSLFSLNAFARDSVSVNVHGLWYRGRIPASKIAYIGDMAQWTGRDASVEDIAFDIEQNTCRSIYIQASVEAMLKVFGPSRKISIHSLEFKDGSTLNFEERPCLYEWRGGRTGRVCYEEVCVSGF